MIKIGTVYIEPGEVVAVYPSARTPGKTWFALRGGNRVFTHAEMSDAVDELAAAGVFFQPMSMVMKEIRMLQQLREDGYAYLVRDESGALFAGEGDPSKKLSFWDFEGCRRKPLDPSLFDGIVEWGDKEATDIELLLEEMSINPEQYEE